MITRTNGLLLLLAVLCMGAAVLVPRMATRGAGNNAAREIVKSAGPSEKSSPLEERGPAEPGVTVSEKGLSSPTAEGKARFAASDRSVEVERALLTLLFFSVAAAAVGLAVKGLLLWARGSVPRLALFEAPPGQGEEDLFPYGILSDMEKFRTQSGQHSRQGA